MNGAQFAALKEMLPPRRGEWRLLHDSSRDGGVNHDKFHELCDHKRSLLARAGAARRCANLQVRVNA